MLPCRFIALLVGLFLLFNTACNTQASQENNTTVPSLPDPLTTESLLPILKGVWVPKEYVQELDRTHSPYQCRAELAGVTEIRINPSEMSGNTLPIMLGMNNHEGASLSLQFVESTDENGKKKVTVRSGSFDWERAVTGYLFEPVITAEADTFLIMQALMDGGSGSRKEFVRIPFANALEANASNGIALVTQMRLFPTPFRATDASGKEIGTIEFSADGNVTGLPGAARYEIMTDFIASGVSFDGILVYPDAEQMVEDISVLGFTFEGEKLLLYRTQYVDPQARFEIEMKELVYTLEPIK